MQSTDNNAAATLAVLMNFVKDKEDNDTNDTVAIMMDNDPKGNDPVGRDPTNAEIVGYLRHVSLHFAFFKGKDTMDQSFSFHQFEFRTEVGGTPHVFEAQFENLATFKVMVSSTEDTLATYPRGNALKSLLFGKSFRDVEAFAVACRNALGDNLETVNLAGSIFVNGKCVDELLTDLEAKANEEKEIATEVQKLKDKMNILSQLVTMFCVYPDFHRS